MAVQEQLIPTTNYFVPRIVMLPAKYDLHLALPYGSYGLALKNGTGRLVVTNRVYHQGNLIAENHETVEYRNGNLVGSLPDPIIWHDRSDDWGTEPGYSEFSVRTEDEEPRILDYIGPVSYVNLHRANHKSLFADMPMKYASPPTIAQIAEFGRFIEGQAVVRIDRERDFGESIALVNPYRKPVVVSIHSHDGRSLRRIRVAPFSATFARLEGLLRDEEMQWVGHVQVTANNRLVVLDIKHSLSDPTRMSHFEHLDPYRSDPTHFPAFRWFRREIGWFLARHNIYRRRKY